MNLFRKSLQIHPLRRKTNAAGEGQRRLFYDRRGEASGAASGPEPGHGRLPGGIAAEAALALGLFLLFFGSVLSLFGVLDTQVRVCDSAVRACRELARDAYVITMYDSHEGRAQLPDGVAGLGISSVAADLLVRRDLDGETRENIRGLNFLGSSVLSGDDDIVINALYSVPVGFMADSGIWIDQSVCCRAWTGRGAAPETESDEDDAVYVYVAENGVVYHTSDSCTHLRLSIHSAPVEDIPSLRNRSGAKYYPCERCGGTCSGTALIATDGNRYHSDRDCPGLKRTYEKVRLDETSLPCCSRCAGR